MVCSASVILMSLILAPGPTTTFPLQHEAIERHTAISTQDYELKMILKVSQISVGGEYMVGMRLQILNKSRLPLLFDPTKVCLEDEEGYQLEHKPRFLKLIEANTAMMRAHSTRIVDRDRSTDARKKIYAAIEIPPTAGITKSVVRYKAGQFPKSLTVNVLGLEAATGVLDVPIQVFDLTTP